MIMKIEFFYMDCLNLQGYGMTEAGPLSISLAFAKEPFKTKPGACGTVVRNAEMKIVDTETGISLPRNKAGEICIRGTKVMKGIIIQSCSYYYNFIKLLFFN